MRALIQRVTAAQVVIDESIVGKIDSGILVLVCAMLQDDVQTANNLAAKIAKSRIFQNEDGRMNKSITDISGSALVVSQFTLAADTRRGNRPGFSGAAAPDQANALYESFCDALATHDMSIAPGKSYASSMSPTILFDDAGPHIVIGAPGAAYIPQAISQSIVNTVDFGMSMSEAVSAPRIAITKNQIIEVSNRIPQFVTDEIEGMGYGLIRNYLSYAFARVHGVKTANGGWQGGADPGRDGVALIV